jgi:fluoride exporter
VVSPNRFGVWVAVAAGGALGTVLRYEMALAEPTASGHFPWATFTVNLVGSLLLGVFLTVLVDAWSASRYVRPLLAVGFCGGLTTFSTWMVESVLLVRDGATGVAALYLVVSLLAGLAMVAIGVIGTRAVLHRVGAITFDPAGED